MKRHIGTWHRENDPSNSEVGELLIDGNHIEFYSRFHGTVFPETFIGEDGSFSYAGETYKKVGDGDSSYE